MIVLLFENPIPDSRIGVNLRDLWPGLGVKTPDFSVISLIPDINVGAIDLNSPDIYVGKYEAYSKQRGFNPD